MANRMIQSFLLVTVVSGSSTEALHADISWFVPRWLSGGYIGHTQDGHLDHCVHCSQRRSGSPQMVAPWANSALDPTYGGYYVGGSSPFYSEPAGVFSGERRFTDEGTFGVDYAPWWSRVRLHWKHSRR